MKKKTSKKKVDPNFISQGSFSLKINEEFFKKLNPNVDMKKVRALFRRKLVLYDTIKSNWNEDTGLSNISDIRNELTNIEYDLQEKLNVPKDIKWHRFWETPHCTCAKMDNYDAHPTGYYSISGDCKWHGKCIE